MPPVHRPQDHHSMHLLCIPTPHVCACPTHAYRMTTRRPTHSGGFQLWSKTRRHNKVHPHAITHKGSWLAPEYAAFAKSGASEAASTERRPGPPQAAPSATKLAPSQKHVQQQSHSRPGRPCPPHRGSKIQPRPKTVHAAIQPAHAPPNPTAETRSSIRT